MIYSNKTLFKSFVISFAVSFIVFGIASAFIVANALRDSNILDQQKQLDNQDKKPIDENSGLNNGENGKVTEDSKKYNDTLTMLLVVTDASGLRTDTIMLLSADKKNEKMNIISIPRDTQIKIDDRNEKINAVTVYQDFQHLVDKIEEISGLPIDYYTIANIKGFRNTIDILGGVEFNVPQNMYYSDSSQDLYINLKKGVQTLNGAKAEQLLRYRRYLEGDVQRTRVQKAFMKELFTQKMTPANLLRIPELCAEIFKNVKTNVAPMDILLNLDALKLMVGDKIVIHEIPGYYDDGDGVSYYVLKPDETYTLFKEKFGGTGAPFVGGVVVSEEHNISPN